MEPRISIVTFAVDDLDRMAAFYVAMGLKRHAGITDGWMTRNEVRTLEDMERADGLDEFIVPSNMTLISVDGSIVPLSSAGAAAADATSA